MNRTLHLIFIVVTVASLLLSACAAAEETPAPQADYIQTAVAMTVAAKNAQPAPSDTPQPQPTQLVFVPTLTPNAPAPTAVTAPQTNSGSACASASLVSETVVDGTIFKPNTKFIKTWEIKNTSLCTWDTNYRIVFWGGDLMGGAYYYNLPQIVAPGATVPISLALAAPATDGEFTSKWVLQTPDKVNFGVGQYSVPFSANIVVNSSDTPNYAVTSVTYEMVREPPTGCPANVTYTAYATVTTNGPLKIEYYWLESDGTRGASGRMNIDTATSVVIPNSWTLHIATTPGTRWMQLFIGIWNGEGYTYSETYPKVEFTKLCGG